MAHEKLPVVIYETESHLLEPTVSPQDVPRKACDRGEINLGFKAEA